MKIERKKLYSTADVQLVNDMTLEEAIEELRVAYESAGEGATLYVAECDIEFTRAYRESFEDAKKRMMDMTTSAISSAKKRLSAIEKDIEFFHDTTIRPRLRELQDRLDATTDHIARLEKQLEETENAKESDDIGGPAGDDESVGAG